MERPIQMTEFLPLTVEKVVLHNFHVAHCHPSNRGMEYVMRPGANGNLGVAFTLFRDKLGPPLLDVLRQYRMPRESTISVTRNTVVDDIFGNLREQGFDYARFTFPSPTGPMPVVFAARPVIIEEISYTLTRMGIPCPLP